MLILHVNNTNLIFVEPIKTRIYIDMLCAYGILYDKLENAGHAEKLNMMEN